MAHCDVLIRGDKFLGFACVTSFVSRTQNPSLDLVGHSNRNGFRSTRRNLRVPEAVAIDQFALDLSFEVRIDLDFQDALSGGVDRDRKENMQGSATGVSSCDLDLIVNGESSNLIGR